MVAAAGEGFFHQLAVDAGELSPQFPAAVVQVGLQGQVAGGEGVLFFDRGEVAVAGGETPHPGQVVAPGCCHQVVVGGGGGEAGSLCRTVEADLPGGEFCFQLRLVGQEPGRLDQPAGGFCGEVEAGCGPFRQAAGAVGGGGLQGVGGPQPGGLAGPAAGDGGFLGGQPLLHGIQGQFVGGHGVEHMFVTYRLPPTKSVRCRGCVCGPNVASLLVPGTEYRVLRQDPHVGTKYQVPGTWYRAAMRR